MGTRPVSSNKFCLFGHILFIKDSGIGIIYSRLVSWLTYLDGVKFINFTCLKIKQNHISSCSLPIIIYESILGFSYSSSFFMQIRLKKILLAVLLLINLAKYNKEINMTVIFLLITFKQSCLIMFLKIFQIF